MAILNDQAILLSMTKLRETSLICHFLTREYGKVKTISKGVRKEASPLLSTYQLFNKVDIVFYEKLKSDIFFLSEANLMDYFAPIREDLEKLSWASYLMELTDLLLPLHQHHAETYDLLANVLKKLETEGSNPIIPIYEIKLLWNSGDFPAIQGLKEGARLAKEKAFLDFEAGKVFYGDIPLEGPQNYYPISKGLLESIQFLIEQDLKKCFLLKMSRDTALAIHQLVFSWIRHKYDKEMMTVKFLRDVGLVNVTN